MQEVVDNFAKFEIPLETIWGELTFSSLFTAEEPVLTLLPT